MSTVITVIPGDGIGPEIMTSTLRCLEALECDFEYEYRQAGLVALEESGGHGTTVSITDAIVERLQA